MTDQDRAAFRAVVRALPAAYTAIFARPPYTAWPWHRALLDQR